MFSEKYLEIKTKLYEGKIDTDFWGNGMYKEHFYCICLLVVIVDSLFEIYCLQVVFRRIQAYCQKRRKNE